MPRKLILLSTLILTLLIGAPPAQAIAIDGKEYWTLDEMPEEELIENYFTITALNPNNSTIRVLFNDEAATRWRPWTEEKDVLKELHLFWWEKDPGYDYFNTSDPSFHRIYDHVAEPGEVWLPANKEVEISIPQETFEILKTTPLYFFAISNISSAVGPRDFKVCLSDIEGRENYECSIMFGKTGGTIYYPTEVKQAPVPENTSDSTPSATSMLPIPSTPEKNESKPTITGKISTSTMRVPEKTTEVVSASTTNSSASDVTSDIASDNISETVEVPLAASPEKYQFPWWIIIFIFSGTMLILWWFIPVGRKKDEEDQKSPKIFEKSLDK